MKYKLLIALVALAPTMVLAQTSGNSRASTAKPAGTAPTSTTQQSNSGTKSQSSDKGNSSVGTVSDQRLKRDIQQLTTMPNGIKLYSFKYLWSEDVYVGVMAQDLLSNPQWKDTVLTSKTGHYSVDYSKLGTQMMTLGEYQLQQQQSNIAITK